MSNQPHSVSRFPSLRKFWKPAVVTGAGGTNSCHLVRGDHRLCGRFHWRDSPDCSGGTDLPIR